MVQTQVILHLPGTASHQPLKISSKAGQPYTCIAGYATTPPLARKVSTSSGNWLGIAQVHRVRVSTFTEMIHPGPNFFSRYTANTGIKNRGRPELRISATMPTLILRAWTMPSQFLKQATLFFYITDDLFNGSKAKINKQKINYSFRAGYFFIQALYAYTMLYQL